MPAKKRSDTEITRDGVIDVDPDQEVLALHYTITSYGADFLVDGIVNRMDTKDIVVPTFDPSFESGSDLIGFQRDFVWSKPQADRFIESLLLGMPVPGIFLVREPDGVFLVLDGHQRLRSLYSFFKGVFKGKEYRLETVQEPWFGLRFEDLEDEDRRRLESSILHATILRQDHPDRDYSAIYSIFERINTGGSPLQPQEIRVALFGGEFTGLIRELNTNSDWRKLYGNRSTRMKDQELILRFFAFYENSEAYERPLKGFLNDYLAPNIDLADGEADELTSVFESTVAVINEAIGPAAFRPVRSLNAAVCDSVMVGVARRLEAGPIQQHDQLRTRYEKLIESTDYIDATTSSTAAEESVETRLDAATDAFRSVK